jgi:hypothetical protein
MWDISPRAWFLLTEQPMEKSPCFATADISPAPQTPAFLFRLHHCQISKPMSQLNPPPLLHVCIHLRASDSAMISTTNGKESENKMHACKEPPPPPQNHRQRIEIVRCKRHNRAFNGPVLGARAVGQASSFSKSQFHVREMEPLQVSQSPYVELFGICGTSTGNALVAI